ncbi:MAG: tRNA (adenosine(37)-N6)-threonylcarbamoyltransferase complex ATPase subunit type 1 TsaE [Candidatus Omnitrophota bacterium]
MKKEILSESRTETVAIGKRLGESFRGGEVVALVGELGSGKTTFAKGIAQGLGISRRVPVTSPSFVLLREYQGKKLPLYHVDAYRLTRPGDLLRLEQEIGLEDYLYGRGVSVLEWADRLEELLPEEYLRVEFFYVDPARRRLSLHPVGKRYKNLVRVL